MTDIILTAGAVTVLALIVALVKLIDELEAFYGEGSADE
jgi:hypothetical protein